MAMKFLRLLNSAPLPLSSTRLPGDLKTMGPPARKRQKRSKSPLESSKKEEPKKKVKKEVKKSSGDLKITSWNVDGLRAWIKKGSLSFILETDQPDILCLQETKCSKSKLPPEINDVSEVYPHQYWAIAEKEGYSGVGLFSKIKPLSVDIGLGVEEHDKEGRCIIAEYDSFILLTTYVPNAGRKLVTLDKRMDWDPHLRTKLKELDQRKPVIACGDFNVAHTEIDLANPKTNKKNAGFTPEEREGFDELLALGFVDTFRKLNPDKTGAYTFWTYMMNARAKNVGWRLDYFLISERWFESKVSDSVIQSQVLGSDHCPLSLLLRI